MRVNIGCGQTPTPGWRNFDNSPSLKLARMPFVPAILHRVGLLDSMQFSYIQFAKEHQISWGDVTAGLPLDSGTVDVLYSSHMLEHLDRREAQLFLAEAHRLLKPGGILRLSVPDLARLIEGYRESGDADAFMEASLLTDARPQGLIQRARSLVVGARNHLWMYDEASLSRLLIQQGFEAPTILEPGETTIADPGQLDLREREDESLYVEAYRSA